MRNTRISKCRVRNEVIEIMSPHDDFEKELQKFKKELKGLMRQKRCNLDTAFERLQREYTRLADNADDWLKIKQRIEREDFGNR